jgi:hypothetical protein
MALILCGCKAGTIGTPVIFLSFNFLVKKGNAKERDDRKICGQEDYEDAK